jgi:hypothetical protein
MEVANLVVVCFKRCSLVKQILHVGQFVAIKAHVFYLGLLKIKIGKTNTWRRPSQSKQIAPLKWVLPFGEMLFDVQ